MKKIINQPETLVQDMLEGFIKVHSSRVHLSDKNLHAIARNQKYKGKVGIVIGGGSGHEPLFLGLLGENMADAVAVGNIFSAPVPHAIIAAIEEADQGAGVICLFGNYAGDVMNFDVSRELAENRNIKVINMAISDDVASAPYKFKEERRGIAGDLLVIKETAAAAAAGYSLEECERIAKLANSRTFSIGVGLASGTNPINGKLNFDLPAHQIEYGLGIHGEPGIERVSMGTAHQIVRRMNEKLFSEVMLEHQEGQVLVFVNGLGSTTLMELYIVSHELFSYIEETKFEILETFVGSYCTTQEMAGFSITIQVLDEELKKLYEMDAFSPHYFHREYQ